MCVCVRVCVCVLFKLSLINFLVEGRALCVSVHVCVSEQHIVNK